MITYLQPLDFNHFCNKWLLYMYGHQILKTNNAINIVHVVVHNIPLSYVQSDHCYIHIHVHGSVSIQNS